MSTQFNCQKHFYFKLFKQLYITIQFSVSTVSMSKTVLFQTIQFSISIPLVQLNPYIGPYQVLLRQARVDLGAMAMKECSVFPKAPALLGPHHQTV